MMMGNTLKPKAQVIEYYQYVKVEHSLIHVKCSGAWPEKETVEIGKNLLGELKEVVDSMMGRPFILIADLTEFQPNTLKVQEIIGKAMRYLNDHGLFKAIEILPGAIQRIGIESAERKSGISGFRIVTKSIEEALQTYEELKKQL